MIETKEVTYEAAGTSLKGFFAYPDAGRGVRPGVLVVHEWWGHNDYPRMRARMLAEAGYVGFALDMYGGGKQAKDPAEAQKLMGELMKDPAVGAARFAAAQALLASDPRVDSKKIAAIGYCLGGAVVLNAARRGAALRAVASFHGILSTSSPMASGAYAGAMLVATGGADPFVPPEQVDAFKKEMDAAGQKYDLVIYPNTRHGFTNPEATANGTKFGLPLEYNPEVDRASWAALEALLARL